MTARDDTQLVSDLVTMWFSSRKWAEELICATFNLSSPDDFLANIRRFNKPRSGQFPNSPWHYRIHGVGIDISKPNNCGGIDFDFDKPGVDQWRLREFMVKQLNDGAIPMRWYRPLLQDPARWSAALAAAGVAGLSLPNKTQSAGECTNSMKKAKHAAGLNSFEYCATLHILHPSINPEDVTACLGIEPSRTSGAGQTDRNIPGRVYDFSHWMCELPVRDGDDLPTFLECVIALLSPHRGYLEHISDEGGEIECFIGIFADRLCDQSYPYELLASLAELRINLRFDFYKIDDAESDESN